MAKCWGQGCAPFIEHLLHPRPCAGPELHTNREALSLTAVNIRMEGAGICLVVMRRVTPSGGPRHVSWALEDEWT